MVCQYRRTQDLDAKWILHVAKFCQEVRAAENVYIYSIAAQETAKHRAKFGWPPVTDVTAVTKKRRETRQNLLGCRKLQNRSQPQLGRSSPYCGDVWRRLLFNSLFPIVDTCLSCEDSALQSCVMAHRWRFLRHFCILYFQQVACSTFQICILNSH